MTIQYTTHLTKNKMPSSEALGSSPPVPTPTSEELERMEQDEDQSHKDNADVPVKAESPPDDTNGDITMADVNTLPPTEDSTKEVKLEDLFADVDDDEDEEFPSTAKPTQSQQTATSSPGPASSPG